MPERLDSTQRIELLLSVLSNLKRFDVVPIDELAAQVGVDAAQLSADLEVLQYAGIPPFGGGDLVPIEFDDGCLCVTGDLPSLDRPIRLTAEEATALVLALEIAGFAADDPLVDKLESALTRDFDADSLEQIVHVVRSGHDAGVFLTLSAAVDGGGVVEIDYVNNQGMRGVRTVEPLALFAERNLWYLSAFDRTHGEVRSFRVENIKSAVAGGAGGADDAGEPCTGRRTHPGSVSLDLQGAATCRIRFSPASTYRAQEWPGSRKLPARASTWAEVDVPYVSTKWVARKVMAAHGQAMVRFPEEMRAAVRALAQERLAEL
jgi:proteasome accessory factor C